MGDVCQKTISYSTIHSDGGSLTPSAGSYVYFPFNGSVGISKDITPISGSIFGVKVMQKGMYYVEFSFVAVNGDSKTYRIQPYVNGDIYGGGSYDLSVRFYQQPTQQKYEVSTHCLIDLNEADEVSWKIFVGSLSAVAFSTINLKMNIINLQTLGIH